MASPKAELFEFVATIQCSVVIAAPDEATARKKSKRGNGLGSRRVRLLESLTLTSLMSARHLKHAKGNRM